MHTKMPNQEQQSKSIKINNSFLQLRNQNLSASNSFQAKQHDDLQRNRSQDDEIEGAE